MSDSESYYSDEYDEYSEPEKAQDESAKPVSKMEWILRVGALANGELIFEFYYETMNRLLTIYAYCRQLLFKQYRYL